jgi:hypothetical protein
MSPGYLSRACGEQLGSRALVARLWAPLLLAAAVAGCVLLHLYPPSELHLPPCVFHSLTGLYCPGCGAARALHHLMNLEFSSAARCNLLFVAALPFLLYALVIKAIREFGLWRVPEPRLSPNAGRALIAVVIAWWVIRNLPFSCFVIPS